MDEKIVLETKVIPTCHVIMADISTYSKSTYILPVLMHVRENGTATPESLSASMFSRTKTPVPKDTGQMP